MNKKTISVEQVLGELENDFNFDNGDWIPRVGAWCISALSQMNLLQYVTVTRECEVKNRIVQYFCEFNPNSVRVFADGCEIHKLDYKNRKCRCGEKYLDTPRKGTHVSIQMPTSLEDSFDHSHRHNPECHHHNYHYRSEAFNKRAEIIDYDIHNERNFIVTSNGQIELNFDVDFVILELEEVQTEYSEAYNQNMPVVINNSNVIEALKWYCMWKHLSRGNKHQIYSLTGNQQTNPMFLWERAKNVARTSVAVRAFDDVKNVDPTNNSFYNATFLPRK